MYDKIETFKHSIIQHGSVNQRIYLMKLDPDDMPDILPALDRLAIRNKYTRIMAKAPLRFSKAFASFEYLPEADIPGFFHGRETAVLYSKFLSAERAIPECPNEVKDILNLAQAKADTPFSTQLPPSFTLSTMTPEDTPEMGGLYQLVFPSYPFPIHDPAYLTETMRSHVLYLGIRDAGRLIAVASAEIDQEYSNAELTDFATHPDYRGRGLACVLLGELENQMQQRHIHSGYTIARALSPGMNITFARHGYAHTGTLINSTNISGFIQSMNVWCKSLNDTLE